MYQLTLLSGRDTTVNIIYSLNQFVFIYVLHVEKYLQIATEAEYVFITSNKHRGEWNSIFLNRTDIENRPFQFV